MNERIWVEAYYSGMHAIDLDCDSAHWESQTAWLSSGERFCRMCEILYPNSRAVCVLLELPDISEDKCLQRMIKTYGLPT